MTVRSLARLRHPMTFLFGCAVIYACSIQLVGMMPDLANADALAVGVTCDLVLVVPALYYLLLVRGRGWPVIGMAPVFVASLVGAALILPAERQALLTVLEWAALPVELGVLGYVGWRAVALARGIRGRAAIAGEDAFDAIRSAARQAIGSPRVAEVVSQEIATFYYALGSWKTRPSPAGDAFTSHRDNHYGVVLSAVLIAVVIETVAVHLLVHTLWSALAAWILTGLGVYGVLWLIADLRALQLRATTITSEQVHVRLGTRWEVVVPRDAVVSVGPAREDAAADGTDRPLKLVLIGDPNVDIKLSRPVTARGMFGLRRTASSIRLQIDDAERFIAVVRPATARP